MLALFGLGLFVPEPVLASWGLPEGGLRAVRWAGEQGPAAFVWRLALVQALTPAGTAGSRPFDRREVLVLRFYVAGLAVLGTGWLSGHLPGLSVLGLLLLVVAFFLQARSLSARTSEEASASASG